MKEIRNNNSAILNMEKYTNKEISCILIKRIATTVDSNGAPPLQRPPLLWPGPDRALHTLMTRHGANFDGGDRSPSETPTLRRTTKHHCTAKRTVLHKRRKVAATDVATRNPDVSVNMHRIYPMYRDLWCVSFEVLLVYSDQKRYIKQLKRRI